MTYDNLNIIVYLTDSGVVHGAGYVYLSEAPSVIFHLNNCILSFIWEVFVYSAR